MSCNILVVEDDYLNQDLISEQVEDLAEVEVAGDGAQALSMIEKQIPDLILLDLNMPRMNGFQLIESLSSSGIDIPIVVITAMDLRKNDFEFFKTHRVQRVFQKGGYSEEELHGCINTALAGRTA